jgi:Family of unknown function (DUF5343)
MASSDTQFPYTTSPPGLKRIMEGAPTWGKPDKVSKEWLDGLGFKGGAASRSLGVMRAVGIVDLGGKPTELWEALRTKDKAKFAGGVRKHYASLFATYPDANRKDTEAILAFVRSKTSYGADAQKLAVRTFKTLCEFGDFETDVPDEDKEQPPAGGKGKAPKPKNTGNSGGVALTVNIQLQLPENASGDVYEKLFAAMEKHLKGLIGTRPTRSTLFWVV